MVATPPPELPGFGRLTPLGRGGYSEVYRAYQDRFDRWVAVKVLTFALTDDRSQRRFLRECRVAGRLSTHPNIVTVYDAGLAPDGRPYISMELFDGGSIADRLRSHGPFSVADTLRIAILLAGALESAHRAGVIHRDVKPGNVLLTAYGLPALTDFGLSLVAERQDVSAGVDALTPYHAPPEVLERTTVGPASDVYSLASTTYTMLAGRAPHQQGDGHEPMAALLLRILQVDVPPIARPDVPRSLQVALRSALARDAEARTPTALAFAEALQQVQRELGAELTEPVVDGRPADGEPAGRPAPAAADGSVPTAAVSTVDPPTPGVTSGPAPGPPPPPPVVPPAVAPPPAAVLPAAAAPAAAQPAAGDPALPGAFAGDDLPGEATITRPRLPGAGAAGGPPAGPGGSPPGGNGHARGGPGDWSSVAERASGAGVADAGTTVHRSVVRGSMAGPPAARSEEPPSQRPSRGGLLLAAALLVAGATAGGAYLWSRGGEPTSDPAPTTTTTAPADLPVPTGLTAIESASGVDLTWEGDSASRYVVLILSEVDPPAFRPVDEATSLFLPAASLKPEAGYCFAVAFLDSISAAPPDEASRAFSPPQCIRGAAEDTVRLE